MAWAHNQERYRSNGILSVVDKIECQFKVNVDSTFKFNRYVILLC